MKSGKGHSSKGLVQNSLLLMFKIFFMAYLHSYFLVLGTYGGTISSFQGHRLPQTLMAKSF